MARAKPKTKAEKLIEAAVDRAVGRALIDHPIPVMSIGKVYARAWELVGRGHTEDHLIAQLTSYVITLEVKQKDAAA